VIELRHVQDSDTQSLESFELGTNNAAWLLEVGEIVAGLPIWLQDPNAVELDRQVLLLTDSNAIVGVAAHEAIRNARGQVSKTHRYLMVTAITASRQRTGLAALLTESIFEQARGEGIKTMTWLVHPANHSSILFSRGTYPEAHETYPPEDKPYVSFTLDL
jgi:GNAT superfamily N-acetyltransferase